MKSCFWTKCYKGWFICGHYDSALGEIITVLTDSHKLIDCKTYRAAQIKITKELKKVQ